MKDSFLTQFTNKASKAHKKGADCFKMQDYLEFLASYLEEGYYQTLAYAVNGQDNGNGQPVIDKFWFFFKIEQQGNSRITQALKKMGKLERIPEIEAIISRFFKDASLDFLTLCNKSTQIYHSLMNMESWEKIEKGLTNNINNEVDAVDKLFMEDKISMGIITRRKSSESINRLIKEVQGILTAD
jgi:hypothetical protein